MSRGEVIEPDHLAEAIRKTAPGRNRAGVQGDAAPEVGFSEAKQRIIEDFESEYVRRCLAASDGNISAAARLAGIDYKNFPFEVLLRDRAPAGALSAPG